MLHKIFTAFALVLAMPASATAEPVTIEKASGHHFSITGSLVLLNVTTDVSGETAHYNLVEATGEWRYRDRIGLAAILGAGRAQVEDEGVGYEFGVFDIGGQAYYCLVGSFDHGLQLGVEALFVGFHGADRYNGSVTATLGGLSVGPFLGYKLALRSGLTVIAQAGGALFVSTTHASVAEADVRYDEQGALFYPIANLNLGWSF